MRPLGPASMALLQAASQGPGTLRDFAQRSGVEWTVAKDTIKNLCRAGRLHVVGQQHVDYISRVVQVYELPVAVPVAVPDAPSPTVALAVLCRVWAG